ncbi:MAG TPA: hypothetical protein VK866_05120 [Acidimicrobiales bacterium]|nr:hypothetical protein [Acidimicrobiales bacterium]
MARPVRVLVCVGGDCRSSPGFAKVLAIAASTEGATTVSCQDICSGPVVGLERDGPIRWYSKVRGDRRRTLARIVAGDAPRRALASREVRARRGRLRRPERRRALRAR